MIEQCFDKVDYRVSQGRREDIVPEASRKNERNTPPLDTVPEVPRKNETDTSLVDAVPEVSKKLSSQIITVITNRGSVLKSLFAPAFAQEHNEQLIVKQAGFTNLSEIMDRIPEVIVRDAIGGGILYTIKDLNQSEEPLVPPPAYSENSNPPISVNIVNNEDSIQFTSSEVKNENIERDKQDKDSKQRLENPINNKSKVEESVQEEHNIQAWKTVYKKNNVQKSSVAPVEDQRREKISEEKFRGVKVNLLTEGESVQCYPFKQTGICDCGHSCDGKRTVSRGWRYDQCRHENTPGGCWHGSGCAFLHTYYPYDKPPCRAFNSDEGCSYRGVCRNNHICSRCRSNKHSKSYCTARTKKKLHAAKQDTEEKLQAKLSKARKDAEEKLRAEKESHICVVCQDDLKTHTFLPCGHKCICKTCAEIVWKNCPICRVSVKNIQQIYD